MGKANQSTCGWSAWATRPSSLKDGKCWSKVVVGDDCILVCCDLPYDDLNTSHTEYVQFSPFYLLLDSSLYSLPSYKYPRWTTSPHTSVIPCATLFSNRLRPTWKRGKIYLLLKTEWRFNISKQCQSITLKGVILSTLTNPCWTSLRWPENISLCLKAHNRLFA